ncbi:hypothetical protein [Elioraea sp.]|nr:hypothetical protein [Elioraea sp.]
MRQPIAAETRAATAAPVALHGRLNTETATMLKEGTQVSISRIYDAARG